MKNLGYSDEYVSNLKFKNANWNEITMRKELYVKNYKDNLLTKLSIIT